MKPTRDPARYSNVMHPLGTEFHLKAGAVVVKKIEDVWYFAYFRSLSRPNRGFQVVRGTVDPGEDLKTALHREIAEEYGRSFALKDQIAVSFMLFDEHQAHDVQIYYLAEDTDHEVTPDFMWTIIDGDEAAQELEWKFAPLEGDLSFLSRGHDAIVAEARRRILQ